MSAAVRAELSEKLSRILKEGTAIKSSLLLRTYATFVTLGESFHEELIKAYYELASSNKYPKGTVLQLSRQAASDAVDEAARKFRHYSIDEFLRFIVPDLVANSWLQGTMPYTFVLERASGTHKKSVQHKAEPARFHELCSVSASSSLF